MGPNHPVYAKPLKLPPPTINHPLPLTPQQHTQLLCNSPMAVEINEAIHDLGELPLRAELERY
jgi:hypothetical protein